MDLDNAWVLNNIWVLDNIWILIVAVVLLILIVPIIYFFKKPQKNTSINDNKPKLISNDNIKPIINNDDKYHSDKHLIEDFIKDKEWQSLQSMLETSNIDPDLKSMIEEALKKNQ